MGQNGCVSGDRGWQLVVPIKRAEWGKSRLVPPPGVTRPELARAMACDALSVAAQVLGGGAVLVVTSDEPMREYAKSLSMATLSDPGGGLNAAISAGLALAQSPALAVLLPDVPALKTHELHRALQRSATHCVALVADHSTSGTCLLTSTEGTLLPQFGADSARRHQDVLDAALLGVYAPGLRQDVDTAEDLTSAVSLGVGPATRALLER